MEGVCLVDDGIDAMDTLKTTLEGLIKYLFPNCNYRFMADSFPFTDPSLQAEVEFNGKWLEILGGGKVHHEILKAHNIQKQGWAFGLGLERFAMVLFEIPDIRLLWSIDPKFTDQFKSQTISAFKPFSKLNSITRDISFWLNNTEIIENEVHWPDFNNFCELVRDIFKDQIEQIELFDQFQHPKTMLWSRAYHLKISPTIDFTTSQLAQFANENMLLLATVLKERLGLIVR